MTSILAKIAGHEVEVFFETKTAWIEIEGNSHSVEYVTKLELDDYLLGTLDKDEHFDLLVMFNMKHADIITRRIENTLN